MKSLDFRIIEEKWCVYSLKNGTIIKVMAPLAKVVEDEGKVGQASAKLVLFVDPSEKDKGKPSGNLLSDTDKIESVKFELVEEGPSIYDLVGKRQYMIILPNITKVLQSDKFDTDGARQFKVEATLLINNIPYPKME